MSKVARREALYVEIAIDLVLLGIALTFQWWVLVAMAFMFLSWDLRALAVVGITSKADNQN